MQPSLELLTSNGRWHFHGASEEDNAAWFAAISNRIRAHAARPRISACSAELTRLPATVALQYERSCAMTKHTPNAEASAHTEPRRAVETAPSRRPLRVAARLFEALPYERAPRASGAVAAAQGVRGSQQLVCVSDRVERAAQRLQAGAGDCLLSIESVSLLARMIGDVSRPSIPISTLQCGACARDARARCSADVATLRPVDRARSLGLGGLETGILADAVRTSAYKCLTTLDLSGNPLKADDIVGLIKVRVAREAARVGL